MTTPRDFIYTTYIKTTPEKVWQALTTPEFTKQYWVNKNISDWKTGSEWRHEHGGDGHTLVIGRVVESNPPHRLVLSWAAPENLADMSQVSFDISVVGGMVRLDVVHGQFIAGSEMAEKVTGGWPRVLSSLKSLLETGSALDMGALKSCSAAA